MGEGRTESQSESTDAANLTCSLQAAVDPSSSCARPGREHKHSGLSPLSPARLIWCPKKIYFLWSPRLFLNHDTTFVEIFSLFIRIVCIQCLSRILHYPMVLLPASGRFFRRAPNLLEIWSVLSLITRLWRPPRYFLQKLLSL